MYLGEKGHGLSIKNTGNRFYCCDLAMFPEE